MTKQEIVDDAVKLNVDMPTLTLARLLMKQHPTVFTKVDNVRAMIRYRRGNKGEANRQKGKKTYGEMYRKNGKVSH